MLGSVLHMAALFTIHTSQKRLSLKAPCLMEVQNCVLYHLATTAAIQATEVNMNSYFL